MAETSLLDAPTDTNAGANGTQTPGSLIDQKPVANTDGKGGNAALASPDKTPPAVPPITDANASKPADKAAVVVPEKYADFKMPDGIRVDAQALTKFDAECKTLSLPQEKRDSLLAIQVEHTTATVKQTMDLYQKQIADWTAETKQMLGADTDRALSAASKAIDRVFTDPKENKEFRELLAANGSGNHRLMVKLMSHYGQAISEDKFVEGSAGNSQTKSIAERIYDTSPTTK